MPELLIELFSEEIPARMQARAAEELCASFRAAAGLGAEQGRAYWGPRRLVLHVPDLPAERPGVAVEERGPRASAPEAALAGFLKKHGATREELVEEKGFWVLKRAVAPESMAAWLARTLPGLIEKLAWPKSMRWGESGFAWVRPLRRILCVFGGAAVPFALSGEAHGLVAGNMTEGHRIHAPGAFPVASFAEYEAELRERFVILDAAERARVIEEGIARLAASRSFAVVPDAALLAEVAGLVEWPVSLLGAIDDAFMDLPPEVMRTTMRVNQKYFALVTAEGGAAPAFCVVANIAVKDGGAAIIAGNERVLRARLSDARFFWDQDRKQRLEDFLPKLESVVFHAKLGTQGQRVARLEKLAELIAVRIGAEPSLAARAAKLAKADLATGMVSEFPELQGVMGRYYALASGELGAIADAIGVHYRPLGPTDAVPLDSVAICVALADKIDQLAGFFDVDEKPSGSGDPYALRRAALGIVRVLREGNLRLNLLPVFMAAIEEVRNTTRALLSDKAVEAKAALAAIRGPEDVPSDVLRSMRLKGDVARELLDFLADRLRVQLRAEGARHDILAAVFAAGADDDLVRLLARADAVRDFLETDAGTNLLAAAKRAQNILRIEEKKEGAPFPPGFEASGGAPPEEQALAAALAIARDAVATALDQERFAEAMVAMAQLRAPLDAFFEKVIVNDPDAQTRHNRLRLLAGSRDVLGQIADFTKIEG